MNTNMVVESKVLSKQDGERLFGKGKGFSSGDLKPLKKKNGKLCDDVDYCLLADEIFSKMDNTLNSGISSGNYGYDPNFVKLVREVAKGYKEGYSRKDLINYINDRVNIE